MKPAGLLLLLPVGLMASAWTAESTASTGRLSQETSARIREGLPAFRPTTQKAGEEDTNAATETSTDPNILVLPKVTVNEKRLPSDAADHLVSRQDFKRKMENLYLDQLAEDGPLNVLLNQFTIPILSPSKAERGRAIYLRRELDRLGHVNRTTRGIAPDAAKKFRDELDNSHTTRPAGGLIKR